MKKKIKQWAQIMMVALFMVLAVNTRVFAADNSGTSFETAGNLSISTPAYGKLTEDCQSRYFTFTTSSNKSWYTITGINSTCNSEIRVILYDADKTQLTSCGVGEHSTNAIVRELTPNAKYYVQVLPYWSYESLEGDFKLTLSETVDDYGDTYSTGKSISTGQTIAGHIDATDDVDYFKFKTSSEKNCYYFVDVINVDIGYMEYELYNSDMVCIYSGYMYDSGSQRTITAKLDPNMTYYLKVNAANTGKYKIKLSKAVDEAYDEYSKATKIDLNKKYNLGIQADGDVDYLKFKTNKTDKDYTIQIIEKTSGQCVYFTLYDANMQQWGYTQTITSSSGFKEKWTLKKNQTFYIKMNGSVGDYSIKIIGPSSAKHNISYQLNGGKNSSSNPSTYTESQTVKLQSASKKGYKFAGWYTDKGLTKSISTIKKGSTKNYTLYAKWTKISLSKASIKNLQKSSNGKVKVQVGKVKTADGYEIQVATNKKMTAGKAKYTMSSTKKTLTLKKGKTYYVKVRAYSVDSTGKKIYGKYSAVKTVKLK